MPVIIALGSNRRHGRYGAPRAVLRAAMHALEDDGIRIIGRSPIIETAPLGPSRRRYANAVVSVDTHLSPAALLVRLQAIEARFGRKRQRRWG
ncbi:MAG: 2-amino-4-hydroxy-6-hydroxymethyldihydropteridine diphosphokinase, partial [Pseudomonadota bacterium]